VQFRVQRIRDRENLALQRRKPIAQFLDPRPLRAPGSSGAVPRARRPSESPVSCWQISSSITLAIDARSLSCACINLWVSRASAASAPLTSHAPERAAGRARRRRIVTASAMTAAVCVTTTAATAAIAPWRRHAAGSRNAITLPACSRCSGMPHRRSSRESKVGVPATSVRG
jgi:hypothetical protein